MNKSILIQIENMKRYACAYVPFYRDSIGEKTILSSPNFDEFPIIDKYTVAQQPSAFISDEVNKDLLIEEYTSGSSGKPMKFYKTKGEMMRLESLLYRRRKKIDSSIGRITMIKFYAELEADDGKHSQKILLRNNALYLSMLYLDDDSFSEYYDAILKYADKGWLVGVPSVIYKFALYLNNSGKDTSMIRYIELTGEMVFNFQRAEIQKAFSCPVRNHYGLREFWEIAFECECGRLHILDEHVFVETLDGEFIVSTLDQRTMPLIRYRTGDRGTIEHSDCPCGSESDIIVTSGGRTSDLIHTRSGRVISSIVLYMAILEINKDYEDVISQFQFIQNSYTSFDAELVLKKNTDIEAIRSRLTELLKRMIDGELELDISFKRFIENDDKSRKYKYFISRLNISPKIMR